MQEVYRLIQRVSPYDFPVLVTGATGTGKELVARSIHSISPRGNKPFVPLDCSTLVSGLIESELFGHVKGAFTGADCSRTGLLQAANGGTLFLDEVGELSLHCQVKLLRAIQEREIRPVGATQRIPIDVRVTAATNRKLELEVKSGRFRQDLYFRLNVVQIEVPALRERKEDIPALVDFFFYRFRDLHPGVEGFSEAAKARLMAYDWPGNVRELENAIEHGIALSSGSTVQVSDLPPSLRLLSCEEQTSDDPRSWGAIERRAIYAAVDRSDGDRMMAARILGIGKTTLYRKLRQYASQDRDTAAD